MWRTESSFQLGIWSHCTVVSLLEGEGCGSFGSQQVTSRDHLTTQFQHTKETNNPICSPCDQQVAVVVEGCAVNSNRLRLQGELQLEGKKKKTHLCLCLEASNGSEILSSYTPGEGRKMVSNNKSSCSLNSYTFHDHRL